MSDAREMPGTLESQLPLEHSRLKDLHGGVWSYSIYSPISLEDQAQIEVNVIYGRTANRSATKRKYTIFLGKVRTSLAI